MVKKNIPLGRKLAGKFCGLSRKILGHANQGISKIEFLKEVAKLLLEFSDCDAIEIRATEKGRKYWFEAIRHSKKKIDFNFTPLPDNFHDNFFPCFKDDSGMERICIDLVKGNFDDSLPYFTKNGSFWTGDSHNKIEIQSADEKQKPLSLFIGGQYLSLAMLPFIIDDENTGILQLKSLSKYFFTKHEVEFYEGVAQTLGLAISDRRAQAALRDRVKELTCLYKIAQLVEKGGKSLDENLTEIVEILPTSLLFPKIASAKIVVDNSEFLNKKYKANKHTLFSEIFANDQKRGYVEVSYSDEVFEQDDEPFLHEEQNLINNVAREVSLIIERQEAQDDKAKLEEQLRHADRLATIGMLSAGVAHELNEPLGNILGYAQLTKKNTKIPKQIEEDIEKIIKSCLHAREVIRKLMLFARQMPPKKIITNLNQTIIDGLYFLESRCAKSDVELIMQLSPDIPEITADPSQLLQVLVNLVVNAIHAMPNGGKLAINTFIKDDNIYLIISDTGIGMTSDVLKKIFIPFFTTKDIDQGTGLGLPVAHGIITAHGGTIDVISSPNKGTTFEIKIPINYKE